MVPVISCREHSSRRVIHEMCETNDVGEVSSSSIPSFFHPGGEGLKG